jgi:hypothetical protein
VNKRQFQRFILRVEEAMSWVPDDDETELMGLLRLSYRRTTGRGEWATELNRLYNFLGPAKSRTLVTYARQCHVTLDDRLTRKGANELLVHLKKLYEEWDDDGISV